MISATDHLKMARAAIEARKVFPSAHATVLRGALVGSAQAYWLLAESKRGERQQRSLLVLEEFYKRRLQYDKHLPFIGAPADALAELDEQSEHMQSRLKGVRLLKADPKRSLIQTEYIEWSLDKIFFNRSDARNDGRLLWRLMSGDAHALGWTIAIRAKEWTPSEDSDFAIGATPGDLDDIAQPFVCSHTILKAAWRSYDLRREPPRTLADPPTPVQWAGPCS
ncbi:hypothetical protein [Microlunatus aurantiacus]